MSSLTSSLLAIEFNDLVNEGLVGESLFLRGSDLLGVTS